MQVFKFGGASVQDADNINNSISIIHQCKSEEPLMIIVSAIGKTTNALEKISHAFFSKNQTEALHLFQELKDFHLSISEKLLTTYQPACRQQLEDLFTEVEWLLHDLPVRDFGYYYDQIVCIGELLSTTIFSFALQENGLANKWLDVRDILRTDNSHREAIVDWQFSEEKIRYTIDDSLKTVDIIVTQGFIGATNDNESTTLGREGSDYTAAIFSNILNATSLTIWKDVDGVMNADPKLFVDAVPIRQLHYQEVIEMAYYGAQVIHPKTIKPLFEKKISLYVKCFKDIQLQGTIINANINIDLPPIYILKQNQLLVKMTTKDFSFVMGKTMIDLWECLQSLLIKPNMIHIGATEIKLCVNNEPEKLTTFQSWTEEIFTIEYQKELTLTSIRHYQHSNIKQENYNIVLEQKDEKVWQYLS